jgi:hypothetical protein
MSCRLREQARSHIWNAFPCGSGLAREGGIAGEKQFSLFQKNFNPAIDLGSLPA